MMFLESISLVEAALRRLAAVICSLIYKIVAALFELFINISRVELLSSGDIAKIYQRVTLIITIIMIFYVTFETVKYVIQPDTMGDKEKGTSKVVSKMIICVVLLAMVPKIFEFAFKLQNTIIDNQIIPKLILGPSATSTSNPKDMGRNFAVSTFALFYGYGDIPGEELLKDENCKETLLTQEDYNKFGHLEGGLWDMQRYALLGKSENYSDYGNGIAGANLCYFKNYGSFWHLTWELDEDDKEYNNPTKDNEEYIEFDGLMAIIVGGFMVYVLALYCIDLGTRVAQLAFLQIIAPIPIIGYLSPKKDNIFSKWVKQCTTTYLDLFLRMILIYFVLFLCTVIQDARADGTLFNNIPADSNKTLLYIAIILGLLMFAQKAPKMLQELFPKMGAASGNFGLKAGERVAPLAARTIGMGIGATRGIGGLISRAANTHRRNRDLEERTGKNRKDRKKDAKIAREERNKARNAYKQAKRSGVRGDALRNKKDAMIEAESKFADAQSKKSRSVVKNAASGLIAGTWTGARTGFGATKLEDINKKRKEGVNKDKQNIAAREQWLNTGGYSNTQRTISKIQQGIGITTQAGRTENDIKAIENNIKANETLIARESDVKSKEDSAKDRSASKIENGEQKTEVKAGQKFEIKDLKGNKKTITISENGTTSSVYADYKQRAETAKTKFEAAVTNVQQLEAAKAREQSKGTWTNADQKTLEAARKERNDLEQLSIEASDEQGKVKKAMQEYAITDILQNPDKNYQDGVLKGKVTDTLTSIAETTRDEKTRDAMREALKSPIPVTDSNGIPQYTQDANGNNIPVYKKDNNGNIIYDYSKYDKYISGEIKTYDEMDEIQTALINIANERTRQNVELKGTKSRLESSDQYAAQKANDAATKPGNK